MAQGQKYLISEDDYQNRRFEIAKSIVAAVINEEVLERVIEPKRRTSLIFTSIMVADSLMDELGYVSKSSSGSKPNTKMHNLNDLLKGGGTNSSNDD